MADNVVMMSGGAASYCAAKRVLAAQDRESVTLLFADTLMEDPDLYRFLDDAERRLNHPVTRVSEGRTPWQLFHDEGMIGNTRADLCSRILKRELMDDWVRANTAAPVLYFGFDFTEPQRLEGVRRAKPWARCEAPLLDPPLLWKSQMFDELERDGIEVPRLYRMGFQHNNCGGFCVKAGHAHFARLLHQLPEAYAYHEGEERAFRERTGKDVAILRDRIGGDTKPMTLEQFRLNVEHGGLFDAEDEGGCNCFAPADAA